MLTWHKYLVVVSFWYAHLGGTIPCASSTAVKNACSLELQNSVLESQLFCRFPVTDFGTTDWTLLLNLRDPRDRRTSSCHRGILGENLRSLDQEVLSKDHQQGKGILLVLFLVACLLVTVKASQHWAISLGRRESALPKTELKREYSS